MQKYKTYLLLILSIFIMSSCGKKEQPFPVGKTDSDNNPPPDGPVMTQELLEESMDNLEEKLEIAKELSPNEIKIESQSFKKDEEKEVVFSTKAPIANITVKEDNSSCLEGKNYKLLEKNLLWVAPECQGKLEAQLSLVTIMLSKANLSSLSKGAKDIKVSKLKKWKPPFPSKLNDLLYYDLTSFSTDWGIGVDGLTPVPRQINHNNRGDKTEVLLISFPTSLGVRGIDIQVSRLFKDEEGGERGALKLLNKEGKDVDNFILDVETIDYQNRHEGSLEITGATPNLKSILFYSLPYASGDRKRDSSDYFVNSLTITF